MSHEWPQGFQLLNRNFFSWRLKVCKDAGVARKIAIYLLNKKGHCHKYICDTKLLTYKKFFFQLEASFETNVREKGVFYGIIATSEAESTDWNDLTTRLPSLIIPVTSILFYSALEITPQPNKEHILCMESPTSKRLTNLPTSNSPTWSNLLTFTVKYQFLSLIMISSRTGFGRLRSQEF